MEGYVIVCVCVCAQKCVCVCVCVVCFSLEGSVCLCSGSALAAGNTWNTLKNKVFPCFQFVLQIWPHFPKTSLSSNAPANNSPCKGPLRWKGLSTDVSFENQVWQRTLFPGDSSNWSLCVCVFEHVMHLCLLFSEFITQCSCTVNAMVMSQLIWAGCSNCGVI